MKKKLSNIIRFFFTLALFLFAFYKAGLLNENGREKFLSLLSNVRWEFVIFAVLLSFVLNLSSSIKWSMLLKSRNINVKLWRIYAYYNIGKFFNLILPTSMGGDVVRIFQLGKYTEKKHSAAASVIVERFTGLVTLIIMAIGAVVINIKLFNELWLTASLGIGAIGLAIIAWLILDERPFKYFRNLLSRRSKIFEKIFTKLDKIRQPVLEYSSNKKAITWALINSLIFQLLAVINVWISSLAFGDDLSFYSCLIAVPVILFIMNIPISIGGIGLMEFGYVFTLSYFGASPSLAISTALLIRTKLIFDASLGGLWYFFLNKEKSPIKKFVKQTSE